MPQIYDNIDNNNLLTALTSAMEPAERADFCVGYFNLRGWQQIDRLIENWSGGDGHCCRLLVGMQRTPQEQLRSAVSQNADAEQIDNSTAIARKTWLCSTRVTMTKTCWQMTTMVVPIPNNGSRKRSRLMKAGNGAGIPAK